MEDIIKDLAPADSPVAIESIAVPIPEIVEPPNNNLRDFGIVILIVVLAGLCYKGYLCTSKKK